MLRFIVAAFALLNSPAMTAYYEERYEKLKQMINKEMAENSDNQMTWQFGKNSYFEGMSKEEIKLRANGLKMKRNVDHESRVKQASNSTLYGKKILPIDFDARDRWPECKYIGLVKDQSNCGSCWAVSSASVMSDRICIAYGGKKVPFISDEDIISCCESCGYGCEGGFPALAFKYWESEGVPTGGVYGSKTGCKPYSIPPCETCRYTANTPECTKQCVSGYGKTLQKDRHYGKQPFCLASVEAIQNQLKNHGPIVVAFRVYDDFIYYKSGIYQRTKSSRFLGLHAVKLIGWGEKGITPYWLVVNSWNTTFGEEENFFNSHITLRHFVVLLPHSALDWLTRLNVSYPMLFKITNLDQAAKNRFTHCGVLEFHQEEGLCYLPHWLMSNLLLCEGGLAKIELVNLPIGSYVKLRPQNRFFCRLSNPSAVLELKLRHFACLTKGDMIAIEYNNKVMEFFVQELRPADAVSIIECDMNVEFETPESWNETAALPTSTPTTVAEVPVTETNPVDTALFPGVGRRLDGKDRLDDQHLVASSSNSMKDSKVPTTSSRETVDPIRFKKYPCSEPPGYYIPDWDYDPNILTFIPPPWFKENEMDARGRPLNLKRGVKPDGGPSGNSDGSSVSLDE
ncbi:hypothetical protein M513_05707 [Trichuris suis]|uniref:Peptidase C1A papain C-terminal domain-containing protein n=1 Tax=Trichuris suis TaxID=68888 RepID=A0A085M897_9BILA|nr:hypothetical protein M513_05707 [Trichuris suis]